MTDILKLKFLPQQWSLFPFMISNVTPTNMLTSENMELETSDKRGMWHLSFCIKDTLINMIFSSCICMCVYTLYIIKEFPLGTMAEVCFKTKAI